MNDDTEYSIESMDALTDTGTSCIIGPSTAIFSIRNQILNTVDNVESNESWSYTFPCSESSKMPSFELLYGGYWMEVFAEDYIIDISTDGSTCALCLSGYDTINYWILGDAFMRGWYSIHDHTNLRMGFVPFSSSSKTVALEASSIPTTELPLVKIIEYFRIFGMDADTFLLYVAIIGLVTCVCVFYIVFNCYNLLFKTNNNK